MTDKQTPIIEQKESIKLIKNTKGYQWEIKILPWLNKTENKEELEVFDIARLESLNEDMKDKFGSDPI
ncbi:MAG: hypothetical protein AABY22_36940 [Nanoarchaeota archaeon]